MPKFYTQYDRPSLEECPMEVHVDEGLVERSGYMETEELVNQLLMAGQNLQAFREAEYADESDIPDDAPGFRQMSDLDAVLEARKVRARIIQKNAEAEREMVARAAKEAADKAAEEDKKKAEKNA